MNLRVKGDLKPDCLRWQPSGVAWSMSQPPPLVLHLCRVAKPKAFGASASAASLWSILEHI